MNYTYSINKYRAVVIDDGSGKIVTINRENIDYAITKIEGCLEFGYNVEYYTERKERYRGALAFLLRNSKAISDDMTDTRKMVF